MKLVWKLQVKSRRVTTISIVIIIANLMIQSSSSVMHASGLQHTSRKVVFQYTIPGAVCVMKLNSLVSLFWKMSHLPITTLKRTKVLS